MKRWLVALVLTAPVLCLAKSPPCASWPTNMAWTVLENAGIVAATKLDESKTRAVRLASERIGKDLYRQIYEITFYWKTGQKIEVLTSSTASSEECSISSVDVYVVSKKFNSDAPIEKDVP
jgi:hypothetical protein